MQEFIELRKKLLEKEYSSMNNAQRRAIFAANGPVLVLAGAGSGKTTVLINRISYLIRFGNAYESDYIPNNVDIERLKNGDFKDADLAANPVRPYQILAITFTNKAAKELKSRLEASIGENSRDVWASTFHSCCVRILRRDIEKLGYENNFTIYDDEIGRAHV